MSAFTGPIEEMGELVENLRALAEVPSQASRQASDDIGDAIELQFDHGIDPYGEPWADLAESTIDKGRTPPPLTDTRAMRQSVSVSPMRGAGIAVTIGAPYAGFHQGDGTKTMPPRHVLPEGELPDTWARSIADAVDDAVERRLGAT